MQKKKDYSKLLPHIHEEGIKFIEKWLSPYWFHLIIKNPRDTKLGDYRFPVKGNPHRITINAGMPKSLCFFTLTHEIAHLVAFDTYSVKIAPHGKEWKKVFSEMIMESIDVYDNDLKPLLVKYASNPKAAFYSDKSLSEYFIKIQNPDVLLLKDLKNEELFKINNRIFCKLEKVKTRYICREVDTNKKYYITGSVPVEAI